MEFRKVVRKVKIYKPEPWEQEIEFREDPLTGLPSRINRARVRRPKFVKEGDISDILKNEDCPFCPHNIDKMTPVLDPEVFPEGRLRRGESVLFPNLYPFSEIHATATVSEEHFIPIDSFTPKMIADNLSLSIDFMKKAFKEDVRFPLYIFNYLPPSGASIIHPHTQILMDRKPTPYQSLLIKRSGEYFEEKGKNYWLELMDAERGGERFISEGEGIFVLTSFSPQGNREVMFIFKNASSLAELSLDDILEFSEAFVRVLRGYSRMGINSFNLSSFSGPLDENLYYYRLHMKIIARPRFSPFYRSDSGFLERFHHDVDIDMEPEEVARLLR